MKTVKIILGIIIALTLVFFGTGLLVKDTKYVAEVAVNKSLEDVFKAFNDTKNIQNWIPEVTSIEVVNDNPGRTGSIYKIVVENQEQEITMTQKVLAYVPNEKVTLFFDAENMLKKDDYNFTEKNGKTIINLSSSCRSDSFIMACMFPYFKGTFQEQDQSYLNNFRAYIENK